MEAKKYEFDAERERSQKKDFKKVAAKCQKMVVLAAPFCVESQTLLLTDQAADFCN